MKLAADIPPYIAERADQLPNLIYGVYKNLTYRCGWALARARKTIELWAEAWLSDHERQISLTGRFAQVPALITETGAERAVVKLCEAVLAGIEDFTGNPPQPPYYETKALICWRI